jgi:hypothetical protein
MEVVFGRGEGVEPDLVRKDHKLAQLVEHLLIAFVVASDRPQPFPVLERARHGRQHQKHEFHRSFPPVQAANPAARD